MIKREIGLNFREALQTPGHAMESKKDILNGDLDPPPYLNYQELEKVVGELVDFPSVLIELPNPMSSPTVARNIRNILHKADQSGVKDRVAVHCRMNEEDLILATECGASRVYLFGGIQRGTGSEDSRMLNFLTKLEQLVIKAEIRGVRQLRLSMEHATSASKEQVKIFVEKLVDINDHLDQPIIYGLGIPDTNGVATPEQYEQLVKIVGGITNKMTLFTHLHNDGARSLDNLEAIVRSCEEWGINYCIETVPDNYPGERVGIKPGFNEMEINLIPESAKMVIGGSSWILKFQNPENAKKTHVAGVHTNSMNIYTGQGLGIASPGMYTIMGTENIAEIQRLEGEVSSKEVLRAFALLGREIAAVLGNKRQNQTIKLAELATKNPELINLINGLFGSTKSWLNEYNSEKMLEIISELDVN